MELLGDPAYGAWMTVTKDLNKESIIYSLGVGDDISWDLELIRRYGCQVFAFDPTPYSIGWVNKQKLPAQFHFSPYGVADYDGVASFNPKIRFAGNHNLSMLIFRDKQAPVINLPVKRVTTIMKELRHDHIDILKMDIEGAEYSVIRDIKDISISQILVEMHNPTSKRLHYPFALLRLWRRGYRHIAQRNEDHTFIKSDYC